MPFFRRKKSPFEDISRERVRDEDGEKSYNITLTIDANPHDDLSGLQLTFIGAPTPFLIPTLFGVSGRECGAGLDRSDFAALRELIGKTTMLEGEFVFRFTDDGVVETNGCYFCDDNGDGVAEGVRKCTSFTSDADATGDTVVDDLLTVFNGADDLVF